MISFSRSQFLYGFLFRRFYLILSGCRSIFHIFL